MSVTEGVGVSRMYLASACHLPMAKFESGRPKVPVGFDMTTK